MSESKQKKRKAANEEENEVKRQKREEDSLKHKLSKDRELPRRADFPDSKIPDSMFKPIPQYLQDMLDNEQIEWDNPLLDQYRPKPYRGHLPYHGERSTFSSSSTNPLGEYATDIKESELKERAFQRDKIAVVNDSVERNVNNIQQNMGLLNVSSSSSSSSSSSQSFKTPNTLLHNIQHNKPRSILPSNFLELYNHISTMTGIQNEVIRNRYYELKDKEGKEREIKSKEPSTHYEEAKNEYDKKFKRMGNFSPTTRWQLNELEKLTDAVEKDRRGEPFKPKLKHKPQPPHDPGPADPRALRTLYSMPSNERDRQRNENNQINDFEWYADDTRRRRSADHLDRLSHRNTLYQPPRGPVLLPTNTVREVPPERRRPFVNPLDPVPQGRPSPGPQLPDVGDLVQHTPVRR